MNKQYLVGSNQSHISPNIYANKAALVLEWLLLHGIAKESFSMREVARELGVSLGLVQRTFSHLVMEGFLKVVGIRTSKRYSFANPKGLLSSWLEEYDMTKKCRMWSYNSPITSAELIKKLEKSNFAEKTAFALHSSAKKIGKTNTNLETLELYILEPEVREKIEVLLELQPQEKGYQILLIEPYYKSMINRAKAAQKESPLLTLLDLNHFPLRGKEQAEFLLKHQKELRKILND